MSLGKQHFQKKLVRHHSETEKKSKTALNAHWFRQFLDKNDDEYTTQATFCLSHFDAMTHVMRAEPIPNDVKFHIILGQNWMKTQAKFVFFKNTSQIPHHFVHATQKYFIFPTRNTLEVDLMIMKLCKTHVRKTARRDVYAFLPPKQ